MAEMAQLTNLFRSTQEGAIGITAPVRNHLRKVLAGVGTAFPAFSAHGLKIEKPIRSVRDKAKEISGALG